MRLADFDYALPPELIAQEPAPERAASRLLRLRADGALEDLRFADFPALVSPDDAVVVNDTRVMRARLAGRKPSGGAVEVFVERIVAPRRALALVRASRALKAGAEVRVGDAVLTVEGRRDDLYELASSVDLAQLLEAYGQVPLPPYIRHAPGAADAERYQTVYAERPGAVAAPTAGLHFTREILAALAAKGVGVHRITLHVGAGTFQPVRVEDVREHRMHSERYSISAETIRAIEGKRVLAVGTTSLRALESHALTGRAEGETDLFVYPGFEFKVVRRLLTNFHLPKSTLLMLACAFGGMERVLAAYRHAVQERYRFFSYGDAMLIER